MNNGSIFKSKIRNKAGPAGAPVKFPRPPAGLKVPTLYQKSRATHPIRRGNLGGVGWPAAGGSCLLLSGQKPCDSPDTCAGVLRVQGWPCCRWELPASCRRRVVRLSRYLHGSFTGAGLALPCPALALSLNSCYFFCI